MKKIIDRLREKLKGNISKTTRQVYLKKSIGNIGRIMEEDDKIICYVDQKALKKYRDNKSIYKLRLNGVAGKIKKNVELSKPVYYIFENIEFNLVTQIASPWAIIIFRNCTFNKNIEIISGNEITFEDNKYSDHCSAYFYKNCFFTADEVNKLTFIDENFINCYDVNYFGDVIFGMKINSKILEFINTKVRAEYPATIKIRAEKTKTVNSVISANEVYIDSNSIETIDSPIMAKSGVIIENINCDFSGNIESPIIFYNGIDLSCKTEKPRKVDEEVAKLSEARQKFLEKLRGLSIFCQQLSKDKKQTVKKIKDNQQVIKLFKK